MRDDAGRGSRQTLASAVWRRTIGLGTIEVGTRDHRRPSRWGPGTIGDHRAETMGRPSRGETIEDTHRETIEDTHRGTIEDTHGIACTVLNE